MPIYSKLLILGSTGGSEMGKGKEDDRGRRTGERLMEGLCVDLLGQLTAFPELCGQRVASRDGTQRKRKEGREE